MKLKKGERAGAIFGSVDESTMEVFGYGTYQGEQVPDPEEKVTLFGLPMDHENHCILLDSGKKVYGCECWWGPENYIRDVVLKGKTIVTVDISEKRIL